MIKDAAEKLNINYSTAKTILRVHKIKKRILRVNKEKKFRIFKVVNENKEKQDDEEENYKSNIYGKISTYIRRRNQYNQ